jgi:hypothetical protein
MDAATDDTLLALIIAKGSPQLAAQLQALDKLPAASEAQALSPFADTSSSKTADKPGRKSVKQAAPVLSPQDSSEMLWQQLVQPQSSLSRQAFIQMLCTASSPGQQPQFFAGKQQTADMFAEAVCNAGWSLDSAAAQAVGLSLVLSVSGSPGLTLQAYLWVAASCLAQPVNDMWAHAGDIVIASLAVLVPGLMSGLQPACLLCWSISPGERVPVGQQLVFSSNTLHGVIMESLKENRPQAGSQARVDAVLWAMGCNPALRLLALQRCTCFLLWSADLLAFPVHAAGTARMCRNAPQMTLAWWSVQCLPWAQRCHWSFLSQGPPLHSCSLQCRLCFRPQPASWRAPLQMRQEQQSSAQSRQCRCSAVSPTC